MNDLKIYLREHLENYSISELAPLIKEAGYSDNDIVKALYQVRYPKRHKLFILSFIGIIIFTSLFIIAGFSKSAEADDFQIIAVASNLIERNVDNNTVEMIRNVSLDITYIVENKTVQKKADVVIGEEFCIDEKRGLGCGIIPIAFKDKKGIQRVALTIKGRTIINLLPNTDWTLAEQRSDGVLFDTIFTLPKRTLAEINSIIAGDVRNNLVQKNG